MYITGSICFSYFLKETRFNIAFCLGEIIAYILMSVKTALCRFFSYVFICHKVSEIKRNAHSLEMQNGADSFYVCV